MEYRLENQKIQIDESRLFRSPDGQRRFYPYQGQIIEIYPDEVEYNKVLDENTARDFVNVSTNLILLPRKLLYQGTKDKFSGYSLRAIGKKGTAKKILNSPGKSLVRTIQILENDLENISRHKILLAGLSPIHTSYNGEYLFLTNPNQYSILNQQDVKNLQYLNEYQLHLLISELFLLDMKKGKYNNSTIQRTCDLFATKELYESSSNFFADLLKDDKNVKQFIKKI